jgi:hypothetical protein
MSYQCMGSLFDSLSSAIHCFTHDIIFNHENPHVPACEQVDHYILIAGESNRWMDFVYDTDTYNLDTENYHFVEVTRQRLIDCVEYIQWDEYGTDNTD